FFGSIAIHLSRPFRKFGQVVLLHHLQSRQLSGSGRFQLLVAPLRIRGASGQTRQYRQSADKPDRKPPRTHRNTRESELKISRNRGREYAARESAAIPSICVHPCLSVAFNFLKSSGPEER